MKYAYIISDTILSGGEPHDPHQKGPYIDKKPLYRHTTYHYVSPYEPEDRFFYQTIEIENDSLLKEKELYLGVIQYFDGNTFGTTHGHHHIVGLFKDNNEASKVIENTKLYSGYKPWNGYFSGLEKDYSLVVKLPVKLYHI